MAHIGMGGNVASPVGAPETTLAKAAVRLESLGRVVARSSLYSTEPVGFAAQPRFVNAVVSLETELEPQALLQALMGIEREFGRDRSAGIPNRPRTLDLDILLLGDLKIREPGLEVPHPRLGERAFVLVPLDEVASNVLDVSRQKTVTQLLHDWHSRHPGETDVVFPIQSEVWSAGARGDADGPAGDLRGAGAPDADDRG